MDMTFAINGWKVHGSWQWVEKEIDGKQLMNAGFHVNFYIINLWMIASSLISKHRFAFFVICNELMNE
jgi:hypothetical protein